MSNSKSRKRARKLASGNISRNTNMNHGNSNVLLDSVFMLIFWPIYIVLWIIIKPIKLFHRIFVRIPDRGFSFIINPLGIFRLVFWIWLCTALRNYNETNTWPWVAWHAQSVQIGEFLSTYTFGFSYLILAGYGLWAVIVGSVCVMFNMASDNEMSSNNSYSNINEALSFRDAEMAQNSSAGKMRIFAQTGFLTGVNPGSMSPNVAEAARFLDADLAQYSSSGKLERLKDLFAGR